uniref:CCHC-type domain-containing protein n=1 Tax=Heliothis virescens TaxID=7102 RepID=A0A2A4JQ53_HELVI
MVLTRSRANSPGQRSDLAPAGADAAQSGHVTPPATQQPVSPSVHDAPTQLFSPSSTSTITMTDFQLQQLIAALRTPTPPSAGNGMGLHNNSNFARCTARFDGAQDSDVVPFIDAIEIYKECVTMEDSIALRGLPMLLTGLAGTWWQGVKHSVATWSDAIRLLRQTFGPRLPPHKIYRELLRAEQTSERTDVFVCKARALIAQLPAHTLPENPVQLDMVYGLLHRRIREKVPRTSFCSFSELLEKARAVEDLLEEGHKSVQGRPAVKSSSTVDTSHPTILSPPSTPAPTTSSSSDNTTSKSRPRCVYCKKFGHEKESCEKLLQKNSSPPSSDHRLDTGPKPARPTVCFGCGAPGVIRSNCGTCNKRDESSASTSFQSITAMGTAPMDARARPIVDVKICGCSGHVILDTGAKLSIASESLRNVLVTKNVHLIKTFIDIKLADGSVCKRNVETVSVDVELQGVVTRTLFVVLPGATDSLLGMNFIRDAGMVLDFNRSRFSFNRGRKYFPLDFEKDVSPVTCSFVALRKEERTTLSASGKEVISSSFIAERDIFTQGGAPTAMALQHIDIGDSVPRVVSSYRSSPQDKRIVPAELPTSKKPGKKNGVAGSLIPVLPGPEIDESRDFCPISPDISNHSLGQHIEVTPRRIGPFKVEDSQGRIKGRYHTSLLSPYVGESELTVSRIRVGPKSPPGRSSDLEGEDIARERVHTCSPPPSSKFPYRRTRNNVFYRTLPRSNVDRRLAGRCRFIRASLPARLPPPMPRAQLVLSL